jgi:hypothetical protein
MERQEPERNVEELEERAEKVEKDIEEARDRIAETEGVDVESDDAPGDD